jgi:hypothetical protein
MDQDRGLSPPANFGLARRANYRVTAVLRLAVTPARRANYGFTAVLRLAVTLARRANYGVTEVVKSLKQAKNRSGVSVPGSGFVKTGWMRAGYWVWYGDQKA